MSFRVPFLLQVAPALVCCLGLAPAQERASTRTATETDTPTAAVPRRPLPFSPTKIADRSFGVGWLDGELWGGGPGFATRFDADGIEFVPRMTATAGHASPLRLTLESVRRGNGAPVAAVAPTRSRDGNRVIYARGAITERYHVRRDGVEQSFVFDELPRGDGDLVVRLRARTDLPWPGNADHARTLAFGDAELGGVHIGTVTGIDAGGCRASGWMRSAEGTIELVLPESFVENAALPLILDPLLGSFFTVAGTDEHDPDVAYDVSTGNYLVVWEEFFAGPGHVHVSGQLVSATGALVGGRIFILVAVTVAEDPHVANVNANDTFAVVWEEFGNLFARQIDAASGVVSGLATLTGGSDLLEEPVVGGEQNTAFNRVLVAWRNTSQNRIEAAPLTVAGAPSFGVTQIVSGSGAGNPLHPAISRSGGSAGRYLIAWERAVLTAGIEGKVVNRSGITLAGPMVLAPTTTPSERAPATDGDGSRWLVAYETSTGDVACRRVDYNSGGMTVTGETPVANSSQTETQPAVSFTGESYLVGYRTTAPLSAPNVEVRSVDPESCGECEGTFPVEVSIRDASDMAIASSWSSGLSTGNRALLTWGSATSTSPVSEVRAQLFRADDGIVQSLGGGCSSGGQALATCAVSGNPDFTSRLQGAAPSAPCALVIGISTLNFPCGPCTLIPDPASGVVVGVGSTNAAGRASLPTGMPPGSVGVTLLEQWVLIPPGPGCPTLGVGMSDAIRIQIE